MLKKKQDDEEIIDRVAALDTGKAELVCRVRVPDEGRAGEADAGGRDLFRDDPVPLGWLIGWPAWGDPGSDGGVLAPGCV